MTGFLYRQLGSEDLDSIRPLWEKLCAYHASLPWSFAAEAQGRPFEPRKKELQAKARSGQLRVEVAEDPSNHSLVGYCISSISATRQGEIDSMYVEELSRRTGIGTELVRRALSWMESGGVKIRTVVVADSNAQALAFYARFGFRPRTIVLQQVIDS